MAAIGARCFAPDDRCLDEDDADIAREAGGFIQRTNRIDASGRKNRADAALVAAGEDCVLMLYEYVLTTGERYRNTEYITLRDGRLVETQVFFGGRV